ncbi:MAG: ribosomal protein S18-alanine N-acetyltransferase [Cyanobacteria bacterium SZAS TMP-1]|nr:ribosomal protein S18-alanine N-acetyltransferase [Cyanobacteria bacterium SZAS TMP-1]
MSSKESKLIEITTLTLSDLEQVMEIEPVAFGSHHWSRQSFMNELLNPKGFYFAARDAEDGSLLGYSGFWLIAGEEAHITTLAVHPDYRRLYIGEKLLIHDVIQARKVGAHWVTLEVRVSNDSAQRLYGKYGFRSLGVRRNYYQDNDEDALVLWTDRLTSKDFLNLFKKRLKQHGVKYPEEELVELFLGEDAVEKPLL